MTALAGRSGHLPAKAGRLASRCDYVVTGGIEETVTADDAGHALVTVDLDDPLEALLRPAALRSSTTPPIIASAGPALWNTMSASMFALSTVNSRKTCMSIVPSSKITAPTTMSSVPAPLDARQMASDRLSMTAATKATRYSPLRISQAKVEPVLVTTPVWASSG